MLQDSLLARVLQDTVPPVGMDKVEGLSWVMPLIGGLMGVLLHLWIRWREKRVYEPGLKFLDYTLAPRRTFVHLLSFLIVGVWVLNLNVKLPIFQKPLSLRSIFPFHWFGGLILGLFADFILKHLAKRFPTFGRAIGGRPSGGGKGGRPSEADLTFSEPQPATPPPAGSGL